MSSTTPLCSPSACSSTAGGRGFVSSAEALWLSHLLFSYLVTVLHFHYPAGGRQYNFTVSSHLHSLCRPYSCRIFKKSITASARPFSQFSQVISREVFSSWTAILCLRLSVSRTSIKTVSILSTRQCLVPSQNPTLSQPVFLDHHWHQLH